MMKSICSAAIIAVGFLATLPAVAQLKLVQRIEVPGNVTGKFDHFGVDLEHDRLFATPESMHVVEVFSLRTGKHLTTIHGIGEAHSIVYRTDLNKLYVADGGGEEGQAGSLKVINGATYKVDLSVPLLTDADNAGFDPTTGHVYVTNGGKDAKLDYVMITDIDTNAGEKTGEIKVGGDTLEAMAIDAESRRLYINNSAMNTVEAIDMDQRKIVETWPVTMAHMNVAMSLDKANHRLFVGCRDGHMVVMDTQTGRELEALSTTRGKTDDMVFDAVSKRIYIATAGVVDVYSQLDPDHYQHLQTVQTSPGAKTARLVPEIHRYFVAAPPDGATKAQILMYAVQ